MTDTSSTAGFRRREPPASDRTAGPSDLYRVIRRRWRLVAVVTLLCLVSAIAYGATAHKTYRASTRLYVLMATGTSVNDAYQGGLAAQQRVTSYSHVAGGAAIAERVIAELGLSVSTAELQSRISVSAPPATTLIDISVTDSTPNGARILANETAEQFRQLVARMETTVAGATPTAQVRVLTPAETPVQPIGSSPLRLVLLGLLGGIALGSLGALAPERFDQRVRAPDQITKILNVPLLASVDHDEPDTSRSFAELRARLWSGQSGPNFATLMITSFSKHSIPSVALRLSGALAESRRSVALVDADVSGGGVSTRLGLLARPGLADWLRTPKTTLDEIVCYSNEVGVVPLGMSDEHTSDLLVSDRLTTLLSRLQSRYDYVIIDTAPASFDATALALSSHYDGTVAVVELDTSLQSQIRRAAASFRGSGSRLIGAVAVNVPVTAKAIRMWPRTAARGPRARVAK